jgi:hypothetical protein
MLPATRQPTSEEKQRFLEYVERNRSNGDIISKKTNNQEFELFSIDYLEMCIDDILLKMNQTKAYKKQTQEQKENININLRIEFLEAIFDDLYELFKHSNILDIVQNLGKDAENVQELMNILTGMIATIPSLADFVITSIIKKYKSLCDEMDYSYHPNLIHSLIKETV